MYLYCSYQIFLNFKSYFFLNYYISLIILKLQAKLIDNILILK